MGGAFIPLRGRVEGGGRQRFAVCEGRGGKKCPTPAPRPLGWEERARGAGPQLRLGERDRRACDGLLPSSCHWLWEREGKEGVPRVCVPARGACVRVRMCELWAGTWSPLPVTPVLQMASLCLIPYRLRKICSSCRRVKTAPLSQRLGVPRGPVCLTLAGSSPHGSPGRD